jgi:hypothetical protein
VTLLGAALRRGALGLTERWHDCLGVILDHGTGRHDVTRRSSNRLVVQLCASTALLASLAALLAPTGALAQASPTGHVYVLNNPPGQPNSITVFARGSDGALNLQGSTPIGGIGGLAPFADGTQGSLILAPDGQRLFAVSAGSNQISVVDVHEGQLTPVSLSGSAGAGPVSLTYGGGLLYVLNAANGSDSPANVAGFSVDGSGALHPLANSIRILLKCCSTHSIGH